MAEALFLYTNRLFTGNRSQVHRWADRLGLDFETTAREWAPIRSGQLKESIYHDVVGYGKQLDIYVGATAYYTTFVIFGTGQYAGNPRIRNPHGKALPVGRDRAWGPKILVFNEGQEYFIKGERKVGRGVSGQQPQNFFKVAHRLIIPNHPATAHIDWDEVPQG